MERCQSVRHYFQDSSTGLRHRCEMICDIERPLRSPIDCNEKCPDFLDCLLSAEEDITTQSHLPKHSLATNPNLQSKNDHEVSALLPIDHVIYISIIGVLCCSVIVLSVIICRRMWTHIKQNKNDMETNTRPEICSENPAEKNRHHFRDTPNNLSTPAVSIVVNQNEHSQKTVHSVTTNRSDKETKGLRKQQNGKILQSRVVSKMDADIPCVRPTSPARNGPLYLTTPIYSNQIKVHQNTNTDTLNGHEDEHSSPQILDQPSVCRYTMVSVLDKDDSDLQSVQCSDMVKPNHYQQPYSVNINNITRPL